MRKILVLSVFLIFNGITLASEKLPIDNKTEFKKFKKTETLRKISKRNKKSLLTIENCNNIYSGYVLYITGQAQLGFANCQLSNQIVEDFDLQGCNNGVNQQFLVQMNAGTYGYGACALIVGLLTRSRYFNSNPSSPG